MSAAKDSLSFKDLLKQNRELQTQNEYLKAELAELRRLIFGSKSERYVPSDERQLSLLGDDEREQAPVAVERISYERKKPAANAAPHGRKPLPADLLRKDIIIEPEADVTSCKKIGEEITEELEYEPGRFYVNRYIRPKYAKPDDEGVIIGCLPSRPIEKGIPGPGLLSEILINKYVDHLPLYRQCNRFKRLGVDIAPSSVDGWVKAAYELLSPLEEVHRRKILSAEYLMVDETPIKVLDKKKKGKSHKGFFWVYYAPLRREVFLDYQETRGAEGPRDILGDFRGFLQSDGYAVYDEYQKRDDINLIGCFAHARRKFFEAKDSDLERATWMLEHIGKLYRIEQQARDEELDFQARHALRQEQALPTLDNIKSWLDKEYKKVLPKSVIGKAIAYSLNQWPKLKNYLLDGRLEIDNNLVENAIRPVAIGRKNYLFAGSHKGAKRVALIYSLLSTAKLQEVEPFEYLKDVISRISDHPYRQIENLLPANWKEQPIS